MDGADVCGTSSRASRRPPDVISAVAILDPRWRRRKWRHPGPGAVFSTPIAAAAQDGGPSASGRHLGWPHLRNRKWGHPRWRPEAEGPPSCAAAAMGVEKTALYYLFCMHFLESCVCFYFDFTTDCSLWFIQQYAPNAQIHHYALIGYNMSQCTTCKTYPWRSNDYKCMRQKSESSM